MKPIQVFPYRILAVDRDKSLIYKHGKIYLYKNNEKQKLLCRLPLRGMKKILVNFSIIERLLRLEPRMAFPLDENNFCVSWNGAFYNINAISGSIKKEIEFRQNMHNPLNICITKGLKGFSDAIYFGEYWGNPRHEKVSIFSGIEGNWKCCYTFNEGEILHIHGIEPDYENGCLYILSGDGDLESNIYRVTENFKNVEKIVGGSQNFRACCASTTKENLLYVTDTPLEENYLYKLNLRTLEKSKVSKVSGPCIYGKTILCGDDKRKFIFATSVEPDAHYAGTWKYRFSTKPGPGVRDKYSRVYMVNLDGTEITELAKFKKDFLPYQLFQFGNVRFPYQNEKGRLYICPQSVKGYHNKTLVYEV